MSEKASIISIIRKPLSLSLCNLFLSLCKMIGNFIDWQNNRESNRTNNQTHENLNRARPLKKADQVIKQRQDKKDLQKRLPNGKEEIQHYRLPNRLRRRVKRRLIKSPVASGK